MNWQVEVYFQGHLSQLLIENCLCCLEEIETEGVDGFESWTECV